MVASVRRCADAATVLRCTAWARPGWSGRRPSALCQARCACRLVKDTSAWTNNRDVLAEDTAQCEQLRASVAELAADALQGRCQAADAEASTAQAAVEAATAAVRL